MWVGGGWGWRTYRQKYSATANTYKRAYILTNLMGIKIGMARGEAEERGLSPT